MLTARSLMTAGFSFLQGNWNIATENQCFWNFSIISIFG